MRSTDAYNCSATQSYSLLVKGLSLGDTVYEDSNFNGFFDAGEPGLANVTVELWDPGADHAIGGSGPNSDLMLTSTTTNAQGVYHFINLQPGSYYMRVLMPAPWRSSAAIRSISTMAWTMTTTRPPSPAAPALRPTPPSSPSPPAPSPPWTMATPTPTTRRTFGLFRGMSVGNLVWQDSNDNGLRDSGEPGIDGVTVQLWNTGADATIGGTDDVLLQTTTTQRRRRLPLQLRAAAQGLCAHPHPARRTAHLQQQHRLP